MAPQRPFKAFIPYQRSEPEPSSLNPVWVLALAILPILGLSLFAWYSASKAIGAQQEAANVQAAQLGARNVEQFFLEHSRSVSAFTRLPLFNKMVATHDIPHVRERLKVIMESDPHITRVFVTDTAGKLWCDYPSEPTTWGRDFSDRDWFQALRKQDRAVLSGIYRRLASPHGQVLSLALPFRVNNVTRSVLVLQYSQEKVSELLGQQFGAQQRKLILVDLVSGLSFHPAQPQEAPSLDALAKLDLARAVEHSLSASAKLVDPVTRSPVLASAVSLSILTHRYVAMATLPASTAYAARWALAWQLGLSCLLIAVLSALGLYLLIAGHRRVVRLNETLEAQNEELQSLAEEMEDINGELSQENEARRSAEEELLGIQAHLQSLVEKGAQALARKEQQFIQAQRLESVGRLAGGVAHDFNNLLTVVLGYSELQLNELPADSPLRISAEEIRKASQRGARLTSQLLTFARRQVLRTEAVDVDALVQGLQGMMEPLLGAEAELKLHLNAQGRTVLVDPSQLEQALVNLLVNARDAMEHGGLITMHTYHRELTSETVQGPGWVLGMGPVKRGPHVCIGVRDNGSGISPEILSNIFEPFFTTKAQDKGTGLGLSMVHGAVRAADGQLQVLSQPGEGTEFILCFPQLGAEIAAVPEAVVEDRNPLKHATVLLVDDDDALRNLGGQILKAMGFKMFLARSGEEALKIAADSAEPIDVLVTDLVMPGMGGISLAEALVAERPSLKVIFMTGYTAAHLPEEGKLSYDFLQKPFAPSDLRMKILASLEKRA